MKKLFYYIPVIVAALILNGCSDDFLEQKNLTQVSDEIFYSSPEDITEAITAVYACLTSTTGFNTSILVSNICSDDCFGGGGTNDIGFNDCDKFSSSGENTYEALWADQYKGIFRANMILKRFDQVEYEDAKQRNQHLGEVYFLRAFFNFRLAQHFGTFPLKTEPDPSNKPKATADEIFSQIASDLLEAIDLLPDTKFQQIDHDNDLGHATKWAAEALLARSFLFYTGYYDQANIVLPDGSTLTKEEVITHLDDCIKNSGHGLLSDFRNQWPYAYASADYPYAANNNLNWIGEDGDNIETIFAIKYSPYGGWTAENTTKYSNQLSLYMGMRGQETLVPFAAGWGGGFVNPQIWESWDDNDLRKKGSIIDVSDPEEGNLSTDYQYGMWDAQDETGYYSKKYAPVQINTDNGLRGMFYELYGGAADYQLWNMQDEVLIRFADVLLMAAELKEDVAPLNEVRVRAQLEPLGAYSLDALKEERRFELAFEGLRYFDLLRWHDENVINVTEADGVKVQTSTIEHNYTVTFRSETGGFLPIPETQVRLSQGVLKQNPGWD